ncbi:MAG: DUF748 domain-containing protein [Burkholderiaceae bacterium]
MPTVPVTDPTSATPPAAPTRGRLARLRRAALVLVAVLALLALVAWLAVPIVVQRVGASQAGAALGRTLRIGHARFNPLTLTLRLDDVALAGPAPGAPDAASFAHLELDLAWRSLWARAPVLDAVRLDAPHVRLARTAPGHFDFDDILARLAKRPAAPAGGEPARFAVYNIEVAGGAIDFDDRVVGRAHHVDGLSLGVPFVSNLPADAEVRVEPRLRFVLDGVAWDSRAAATPFRTERNGDVSLHTGDIALAPWLPYWPASLGWHPARGLLRVDASLRFDAPAQGTPRLVLAGDAALADLALVDAAGRPLVAWRRLAVGVREARPLEQSIALGKVALDGLDVAVSRDEGGTLNVMRALGLAPVAAPVSSAPAHRASVPAPAASAAAQVASSPGWRVQADAVDVTGARIAWRDAAVRPAAAIDVTDIALHVDDLRWPLPELPAAHAPASASAPAPAQAPHEAGSAPAAAASAPAAAALPGAMHASLALRWAAVGAQPAAHGQGQSLRADGRFAANRSTLALDVGFGLPSLRPYLAAAGLPWIEGAVQGAVRADWAGALGEVAPTVALDALHLADVRIHADDRAPPALAWSALDLDRVAIDLAHRRVELGAARLLRPEAWVERDAGGALNLARLGPATAAASAPKVASASTSASRPAPASTSTVATTASAPPPWRVRLGEVEASGGRVHWRDQAPAGGPVALDLEDVRVQLRDAAWPAAAKSTSQVLVAATVRPVAARLGAATGEAARTRRAAAAGDVAPGLSFEGRVGLAPVSWSGQLKVARLPLHALDPYLADASPVRLLRARLGWKGTLQGRVDDAGLALHLKGDGELADLRARARHPAAAASAAGAEPVPLQAAGAAPAAGDGDLLRWQSLSVAGTDVRLQPGRPPAIGVDAVRLAGAYARLVVTEAGHFNLTDLAPPAGASAGASQGRTSRAPGGGTTTVAAAPPASASVAEAAASVPQPDIRIGAIAWSDARIEYTDRFVKPNYSAELSDVQGSLGAISTRSPALAPLRLQGRVAGTGTLDVSGQVNPLARPLSLDVRAAASDIELAPLSPYAGKYAGYAIERGKLSMDLHYQVAPDGRLQATNRVVLNQLTFGEKVDSPSATTLPVRLAVALLKDRNGVIDVNLPVGGSINDPQFSVGGLVGRLIVNLLERALTAPFALLSGGGERDLSRVPFVAGTARPGEGADAVLDSVAKALQERPGLQLTITGLADDAREHAALQAANLDARLVQMRRAELQRAGGAPAAAAMQEASALSPDDRARLVARLYAATALPDKPRNFVGLAREVPQAEMESRLAAGLPLPPDAARTLATQRAQAVRDALAARGLPGERIFMAAPRLQGRDGAARPPDWQPHVVLALSTK